MGEVRFEKFRNGFLQSLTKSRYIDIETGRRSDAAHNYIYNQSHNTNLTVMDKSRVIRVVVEYGSVLDLFPGFNWFLQK
jgi:hypothetical protein